MKKLFIVLLPFLFCQALFAQTKPKQDKDDQQMILIGGYDDEDYKPQEPAKKTSAPRTNLPNKPAENIKPADESIKTLQKKLEENNAAVKEKNTESSTNDKKTNSQENKTKSTPPKGYKEYEFESFKIYLPSKCELKKEEKDSASIVAGNTCRFRGKIGAFEVKVPMKELVDSYKGKCQKNSKKALYRRWIRTETLEGYISVCEGEKETDIIMEADSNSLEKSWQFIGKMNNKFDQNSKEEIYISFTSITEK
ncbi:MAG: hypothetical protein Fur0012_06720 [Elusimicrobiota bacterium]